MTIFRLKFGWTKKLHAKLNSDPNETLPVDR
jgi:hypothetical protein